jgi:hypothetical protein
MPKIQERYYIGRSRRVTLYFKPLEAIGTTHFSSLRYLFNDVLNYVTSKASRLKAEVK